MLMTNKENFITIDKDQNLSHAIDLMDKNNISRLMVTDDGKIMGILTEGDIGERLGTGRERKLRTTQLHVSGPMTKDLKTYELPSDAIYVSSEMKKDIKYSSNPEIVVDIARLMIEEGFSSVPLTEDGEIIGLVTKTDLIGCLNESKKPVKHFYTDEMIVCNPHDSLVHARKMMQEYEVERLVVMNKGMIAGIVTTKDIAEGLNTFRRALDSFTHPDIKRLRVQDVMTSDPVTIDHEAPVYRVVQIMQEEKISGIPVTGPDPGIITKTDLIREIASGNLP